jgi:hypothetical protein
MATENIVQMPIPESWKTEGERIVSKMMGPRRPMDEIAAEAEAKDPASYAKWRRRMVHSARVSLRLYRADPHPHMTADEFKAHLLRNYETAVVNEVFERMGPRLTKKPAPLAQPL